MLDISGIRLVSLKLFQVKSEHNLRSGKCGAHGNAAIRSRSL
jgi:hypothetical protein